MKSKIFALMLTVAMTAGVLAGCGPLKQPGVNPIVEQEVDEVGTDIEKEAEVVEEKEEEPEEKKVEAGPERAHKLDEAFLAYGTENGMEQIDYKDFSDVSEEDMKALTVETYSILINDKPDISQLITFNESQYVSMMLAIFKSQYNVLPDDYRENFYSATIEETGLDCYIYTDDESYLLLYMCEQGNRESALQQIDTYAELLASVE